MLLLLLLKEAVVVLVDGGDCEDGCVCCSCCCGGDNDDEACAATPPLPSTCSNTNTIPSVPSVAAYLATFVVTLLTSSILPAACCFAKYNNDRANIKKD